MKESIDLTEHRDFRGDGTKSPVVYPHKKLPWKKTTGDFDLAEIRSNISSRRVNSITIDGSEDLVWNISSIDWTDSFQSNEDQTLDQLSSTFRLRRSRFNNRTSSTLSNMVNTVTYNWVDTSTLYMYDGETLTIRTENEKYEDFPTGKRDYIKSHRAIKTVRPRKYYKRPCVCSNCKNKIPRTPWNDDTSKWHPLCETCKEKEKKSFNKKDRWSTDNLGKHSLTRSYKIHQHGMVPCLSRNLPMEKVEKDIPKRYIEWRDMYTRDFIYDFFEQKRPESMRRKAVYYKGRNVQRREEPWQPKGRIRQDYDSMFNNTDWRDMLKKRIGILDRESILNDKSSNGNLILNNNNDLIFIA